MGRHPSSLLSLSRTTGAGTDTSARPDAYRFTLPGLAFTISFAIILVFVVAPDTPASAHDGRGVMESLPVQSQQFTHTGDDPTVIVRDSYGATAKPKAPLVAIPDPGTAKAFAYGLVKDMGWGEDQYSCLVALWTRESQWNALAENPYSGAYGIPQSLPGNKMASAGADWKTNPETQIRWGLGYITGRYITPCGAWEHSERKNWY